MLLNFTDLVHKYNLKIKGVIQVGAHFGQEFTEYEKHGIKRIVFIEPCKKAFNKLIESFGGKENIRLFNTACGEEYSRAIMYTGDNTINKGMSNSLLKPAKHLQIHPDVEFTDTEEVDMCPLDGLGLRNKGYDLLVMDCQGYEGYILRGGLQTLKQVNYVYTEVNRAEVYEKNTLVDELDELLNEFERVETGTWVGNAWSDAFYIRKTLLQ